MLHRFSFLFLFSFKCLLASLISLSIVTHCSGRFNSYLKSISEGPFKSIVTACISAHFTWRLPFFLCHIINCLLAKWFRNWRSLHVPLVWQSMEIFYNHFRLGIALENLGNMRIAIVYISGCDMRIAIVYFSGCDVMNFEINFIFLIKPFFYMTKK